jgi:hypothetical protein
VACFRTHIRSNKIYRFLWLSLQEEHLSSLPNLSTTSRLGESAYEKGTDVLWLLYAYIYIYTIFPSMPTSHNCLLPCGFTINLLLIFLFFLRVYVQILPFGRNHDKVPNESTNCEPHFYVILHIASNTDVI